MPEHTPTALPEWSALAALLDDVRRPGDYFASGRIEAPTPSPPAWSRIWPGASWTIGARTTVSKCKRAMTGRTTTAMTTTAMTMSPI